jgi:hypothetical protein
VCWNTGNVRVEYGDYLKALPVLGVLLALRKISKSLYGLIRYKLGAAFQRLAYNCHVRKINIIKRYPGDVFEKARHSPE